MSDETEICESVDTWSASTQISYNFFLCFCLPTQFCLALVFVHKVNHAVTLKWNHPLARAVFTYLFCSAFGMAGSFYLNMIVPMVQTKFDPDLDSCRITVFFTWLFSAMGYISLLQVFILRLKSAFVDTVYEVSKTIEYAFRGVFGFVLFFGLVLISIKAAYFNCWAEKKFGFLGNLPIFPRKYLSCTYHARDHWLTQLSSGMLGVTILVGTSMLLYMFIKRLRVLNEAGNTQHYSAVIEKSMIVSIVGMVSTLVSFLILIITSFYAIIFLDHVINSVMLYMMFNFGDDLYHKIFDGMVEKMRARFSVLPQLQVLHKSMQTASKTDEILDADNEEELAYVE